MRLLWTSVHGSSTLTLCLAQASTITVFTLNIGTTTRRISVPVGESPIAESPSTALTTFLTVHTSLATTTTLSLSEISASDPFPTILPTMPNSAAASSSGDSIVTFSTVTGVTDITVAALTTQFSAVVIQVTTDAFGHTFSETLTSLSSITPFSVSSTTSLSNSGSQTASQTASPTGIQTPSTTTSPISSPISPPMPSPGKKAMPWVPIVVVLSLLFAIPIIWFLRRLVMKRRSRSSRDSEARPRLVISAPIMVHHIPRSPPGSPQSSPQRSPPPRPSRPASLRGSTIEEMQGIPTLTPVTLLPKTPEVDDRPTSFRPDPLRFYKDGTTNVPLAENLPASPQSEAWRPTSSVYSGANDHFDLNNPYIPYRAPDSPAARSVQGLNSSSSGVHDETLRKLERGEENTRPETSDTISDGEEDTKSEGSYDWATARAQRLLAEKRNRHDSPPIPPKSPLRSL